MLWVWDITNYSSSGTFKSVEYCSFVPFFLVGVDDRAPYAVSERSIHYAAETDFAEDCALS